MKRNCKKLLTSVIAGCCTLGLVSCGSETVTVKLSDVINAMWAKNTMKMSIAESENNVFNLLEAKSPTDTTTEPDTVYLAGDFQSTLKKYSYIPEGKTEEVTYNSYDADWVLKKGSSVTDGKVDYDGPTVGYLRNSYVYDYSIWSNRKIYGAKVNDEKTIEKDTSNKISDCKVPTANTLQKVWDSYVAAARKVSGESATQDEVEAAAEKALRSHQNEEGKDKSGNPTTVNYATGTDAYGVTYQETVEILVETAVKLLSDKVTFSATKTGNEIKADVNLIEIVENIVTKVMNVLQKTSKCTTIDQFINALGLSETTINDYIGDVNIDDVYDKLMTVDTLIYKLKYDKTVQNILTLVGIKDISQISDFGRLLDVAYEAVKENMPSMIDAETSGEAYLKVAATLKAPLLKVISDMRATYYANKFKNEKTKLGSLIWCALDTLNNYDTYYILENEYSLLDGFGWVINNIDEIFSKSQSGKDTPAEKNGSDIADPAVGDWNLASSNIIKYVARANTILTASGQKADLHLDMNSAYLLNSAALDLDLKADLSVLGLDMDKYVTINGGVTVTFEYPDSINMIDEALLIHNATVSSINSKNDASSDVVAPAPAEAAAEAPAEAPAPAEEVSGEVVDTVENLPVNIELEYADKMTSAD